MQVGACHDSSHGSGSGCETLSYDGVSQPQTQGMPSEDPTLLSCMPYWLMSAVLATEWCTGVTTFLGHLLRVQSSPTTVPARRGTGPEVLRLV